MTWLRMKRWLAFMKRKRKNNKDRNQSRQQICPAIESNAAVAEAMSVLGKPSERLPTQFVKDCGYIPVVLTNAAFVIEKNLKTKGLFQTQGNVSKVNACLNHLLAPRLTKIKHENVHDIIEAIKTFLVRLPEPLMPESVCDALIARSPDADATSQYVAVLAKFRSSSPQSFAILQFMMVLLKRISEFSEYNSMDVRKLATVFVLDIIKPLKLEDSNEGLFLIERMQRLPYLIMVVENIINQIDIFQVINHPKDSQSSPTASLISAEKSNNGLSPAKFRGRTLETIGAGNPTGEGSNSPVFTSRNDVAKEFQNTKMEQPRKGAYDATTVKPPDQVVRSLSEPRKESFRAADICKRCVTAHPVCTSEEVSDGAESHGDMAMFAVSPNESVPENTVNLIEISLEPAEEQQQHQQHSSISASAANAAPRKTVSSKTATLGGKKWCTPRGATCSPIRRKPTKKDADEAPQITWDIRSHRSMDVCMAMAPSKRKRKCRSMSKKSKRELDRGLADNSGRFSDFTTFQPDEEITPWNECSTNSDDTSVMVKTIRNPRVLAYAASTPVTAEPQVEGENPQKIRERLLSSNVVPQILLANYGFRTISRQNNVSIVSGSSNTTSSSGTSFCLNLLCPTPEVGRHSSCSNATPISKDLIRGIKLKGSVGVNTSPCLDFSITETKCEDIRRKSEKAKEVSIIKTPSTSVKELKASPRTVTTASSKHLLPPSTKTATVAPSLTEFGARSRIQGSVGGPSAASLQCPSSKHPCSNLLTVTGRSDRSSAHVTFRQPQIWKALKVSGSSLEQKARKQPVTLPSYAPGVCIREWFVDAVLAFITVLCISLMFLVYEYDNPKGGWLK